MDDVLGLDERFENVGTEGSHQISDDVPDDDDGGRELDAEILLHADDQRHSHREDGQKELVLYSGQPAGQRHGSMQQSKDVDNPRRFHASEYVNTTHFKPEVRHFAPIIQFSGLIRHENPTIRPVLSAVRLCRKVSEFNNDYFRKLCNLYKYVIKTTA